MRSYRSWCLCTLSSSRTGRQHHPASVELHDTECHGEAYTSTNKWLYCLVPMLATGFVELAVDRIRQKTFCEMMDGGNLPPLSTSRIVSTSVVAPLALPCGFFWCDLLKLLHMWTLMMRKFSEFTCCFLTGMRFLPQAAKWLVSSLLPNGTSLYAVAVSVICIYLFTTEDTG